MCQPTAVLGNCSRMFRISSAVTPPVAPGENASSTSAVRAGERRADAHRVGREIVAGDQAAVRRHRVVDGLRDLAAVERVRSVAGDQLEAPRQVRIGRAIAFFHAGRRSVDRSAVVSQIDAPGLAGRGQLLDLPRRGQRLVPVRDESATGELDRRLDRVAKLHACRTARARARARRPSRAPPAPASRARSRRPRRSARQRGRARCPLVTRNIDSCARIGAQPLKSSAMVSPRRAMCTSIVPDPAIVDMKGSTTVMANAVATAASTALPPRSRIRAPTRAPSGCSAATMPCGAGAVFFVTTRRDSIIGFSRRDGSRQGRIAYCVMSTTVLSFM